MIAIVKLLMLHTDSEKLADIALLLLERIVPEIAVYLRLNCETL
jgi:hypothetical protein